MAKLLLLPAAAVLLLATPPATAELPAHCVCAENVDRFLLASAEALPAGDRMDTSAEFAPRRTLKHTGVLGYLSDLQQAAARLFQ